MVFAGIYPVDTDDFEELRASLEKLQLNDASLVFEPRELCRARLWLSMWFPRHAAHGNHTRTARTRIRHDGDHTVPNVSYHAFTRKSPEVPLIVNNPTDLPDPSTLDHVEEPYIKASIITKSDFVGNVMSLCIEKRGQITNQTYLTTDRVEIEF